MKIMLIPFINIEYREIYLKNFLLLDKEVH